jgi:hypothetical protein
MPSSLAASEVGDEIRGLKTQLPQALDHDGRRREAVHVVVAVHEDLCPVAKGVLECGYRLWHAADAPGVREPLRGTQQKTRYVLGGLNAAVYEYLRHCGGD